MHFGSSDDVKVCQGAFLGHLPFARGLKDIQAMRSDSYNRIHWQGWGHLGNQLTKVSGVFYNLPFYSIKNPLAASFVKPIDDILWPQWKALQVKTLKMHLVNDQWSLHLTNKVEAHAVKQSHPVARPLLQIFLLMLHSGFCVWLDLLQQYLLGHFVF